VQLDLVEALRCPAEHAESWLVASITERAPDGAVLAGTLGCPVCFAEYPIIDGIAHFGASPVSGARAAPSVGNDAGEAAIRAGALLGATEGVTLVLVGAWSAAGPGLTALMPVRAYVVNGDVSPDASCTIAVLTSASGIPLRSGVARGVALDEANADPLMVATAVRVLGPGGRLVAPIGVERPAAVTELARDDRFWVGETALPLVPLRRG